MQAAILLITISIPVHICTGSNRVGETWRKHKCTDQGEARDGKFTKCQLLWRIHVFTFLCRPGCIQDGETALTWAAGKKGCLDIVEMLVSHGAELNIQDNVR